MAVALIGGLALLSAILIHRLLKMDMRYLKKDIDNLDTKLSEEIRHTRELLIAALKPSLKEGFFCRLNLSGKQPINTKEGSNKSCLNGSDAPHQYRTFVLWYIGYEDALSGFAAEVLKTIRLILKIVPKWVVAITVISFVIGFWVHLSLELSERKDIAVINKDIASIKANLNNHIGGTNKKIDKLSDRFDKLSDRFDNLYELLLQNKDKD